MQELPKITIITPVLNAEKLIEECILSVANQTYTNKEHLIIDGLSIDGSMGIIKKYAEMYPNIRWVSEKDGGIYDAMNKGIDLAQGGWIYFLGSDDTLCNANILDDIFGTIDRDDLDVIYGNVKWGDTGKLYDGQFTKPKLVEKNICHQAIFFKKSIFNSLGKFNLKYPILADKEFNMKWFNDDRIKFEYVDIAIAKYFFNGCSTTVRDENFYYDRESLIEKYFPEGYLEFFQRLEGLKGEIHRKKEEIKQKDEEIEAMKKRLDSFMIQENK